MSDNQQQNYFDTEAALKEHPESDVASHLAELHGVNRDAYLKDGMTDKDFIDQYSHLPISQAKEEQSTEQQFAQDPYINTPPESAATTGAFIGGSGIVADVLGKKMLNRFGGDQNQPNYQQQNTGTTGSKTSKLTGTENYYRSNAEIENAKREVHKHARDIESRKNPDAWEISNDPNNPGVVKKGTNAAREAANAKAAEEAAQATANEAKGALSNKSLWQDIRTGLPAYAGRLITSPLALAGAGYSAQDALNQYHQGNYGRAAIAGLGTAGSLASEIPWSPNPYTDLAKTVGIGTAIGAPLLNRAIDAYYNAHPPVKKAGGGALDIIFKKDINYGN
jgi:hypothetical protein